MTDAPRSDREAAATTGRAESAPGGAESAPGGAESTPGGAEAAPGGGLNPERILAEAAELASDRKALDIVALDLRGLVGYADYLLICSGRSDRQAKAIHDAIYAGLKDRHRLLPRRVEGFSEGRWILIDYLDVVVHVFTPETREHYRLEQLWGEAPVVELPALVA